MDLDITAKTRSLIVLYESDRSVPNTVAREALPLEAIRNDHTTVTLQPWGKLQAERPVDPQAWARAFHENDRFADQLLLAEAKLGIQLPVHLFGRAPLPLMLHLGHLLKRRPLAIYQELLPSGAWVPGHDTGVSASADPFFTIEGLPSARQGGHGHVVLTVEITHPCDTAIQTFQARHGSELLATVRMRAARGPGHAAVMHPGEAAQAVKQFRDALDVIHRHFEGAESVLLALACPASLAAALGTAINPDTHRPVRLHQFLEATQDYLPVHVLQSRRRRSRPEPSREEILEATEVLEEVAEVHADLLDWLKAPAQKRLAKLLGEEHLLQSKVKRTPTLQVEPLYRHVGAEWTFPVELLTGFRQLRQRLGSRDDWLECVRLLLVHEAFHVQQRGPTSYSYGGSGRTGWVLEAVDYDADVVSFQAALEYRRSRSSGAVEKDGAAGTLSHIVWNALESVRVFEPERPVVSLSERRLRRYLIWLFHACRLHSLSRQRIHKEPSLERPFVEIAGLPAFPDPNETYFQQAIRLDGIDPERPGNQLALALYFRQELARSTDGQWIARLLQALREWDAQPREKAQRQVQLLFEQFFDKHLFLVDRE